MYYNMIDAVIDYDLYASFSYVCNCLVDIKHYYFGKRLYPSANFSYYTLYHIMQYIAASDVIYQYTQNVYRCISIIIHVQT